MKHERDAPIAITWRLRHWVPGNRFEQFATAVAYYLLEAPGPEAELVTSHAGASASHIRLSGRPACRLCRLRTPTQ